MDCYKIGFGRFANEHGAIKISRIAGGKNVE
jgi:hypothetical protein